MRMTAVRPTRCSVGEHRGIVAFENASDENFRRGRVDVLLVGTCIGDNIEHVLSFPRSIGS